MAKSSKGSAWERDLCKILSKWIQGSVKPYIFWRGRGSGAIFSQDTSVGEAFSGDIYCVRDDGKFLTDKLSIEAKNGYPGLTLDNFLKDNKSDPLKSFWEQSTADAEKSKKHPMLIYKKLGMPVIWMCIDTPFFDLIKHKFSNSRYMTLNWDVLPTMYIISFNEFIENVSAEECKEFLKKI